MITSMFLRNIFSSDIAKVHVFVHCNGEKRSLLTIRFLFRHDDYLLQIERRVQDGERKRRKATVRWRAGIRPGGRPICCDHNSAWAAELSCGDTRGHLAYTHRRDDETRRIVKTRWAFLVKRVSSSYFLSRKKNKLDKHQFISQYKISN